MAIMTPGVAFSELRGSTGGITVHRGAYGAQLSRTGRRGVGSRGYERVFRGLWVVWRALWRSMDDSSRLAWTREFGSYNAAFGAFVQMSQLLALFGEEVSSLLPQGPCPEPLTSAVLVGSASGGTLSVTFTPAVLGADLGLVLECRTFRSWSTKTGGSGWRFMGCSNFGAESPGAIEGLFTAVDGALYAGRVVGVRLRVFSRASRRLSSAFECRCVIGE